MDRLPAEIYDMIVSLLATELIERPTEFPRSVGRYRYISRVSKRTRLPMLATISRRFQHSVERITFRSLDLGELTKVKFRTLREVLTAPRMAYLRKLKVIISVPGEMKVKGDQRALRNTVVFTFALRSLLQLLAKNTAGVHHSQIRPMLDLTVSGAMPTFGEDNELISPNSWQMYAKHRLQKPGLVYPSVPRIRKLILPSRITEHGYFDPSVIASLTASMPNVQGIYWKLLVPRVASRPPAHIAENILTMNIPESVERFRFHYKPAYYGSRKGELRFDHDEREVLTVALKGLTKNVTSIWLDGPMAMSIFDNIGGDGQNGAGPFWQKTRNLRITIDLRDATMMWIEDRTITDVTKEDEDRAAQIMSAFHALEAEQAIPIDILALNDDDDMAEPNEVLGRETIYGDKVDDWLKSFASCCSSMPALEYAEIELKLDDSFRGHAYIAVTKEVRNTFLSNPHRSTWNIIMGVTEDWNTSTATIKALRDIGMSKEGIPCNVFRLPKIRFGTYY